MYYNISRLNRPESVSLVRQLSIVINKKTSTNTKLNKYMYVTTSYCSRLKIYATDQLKKSRLPCSINDCNIFLFLTKIDVC